MTDAASSFFAPKASKRRRKGSDMLSVEEVAMLLELPPRLILARARLSFFSGARQTKAGIWEIPLGAVKAAARCAVEPHWSIKAWAGIVGMDYHTVYSLTVVVDTIDAEDNAKPWQLRAVRVWTSETTFVKRIPESEFMRWLGARRVTL